MTTPTEARQLIEAVRRAQSWLVTYGRDGDADELHDVTAALETFLPTDETETIEWGRRRIGTEVVFGPYNIEQSEMAGYESVTRRAVPWSPVTREAQEPKLVACPHWEPGTITMRKGCTACEGIERRREAQEPTT